MHALGQACCRVNQTRATETRFLRLGRLFVAFAVIAVARYSVVFVHEQHLLRAQSLGLTEADMRTEADQVCRMASMHDWLLDVVQPAHAYFERHPARRSALVQTVSTLEAALLVFNLWLFVFDDWWVILQILAAFFSVLGIQCLWWSPMPCNAATLSPGEAWLSDLLAGGNVVMPLGGVSGSTVFVTVSLYNVWRQRRHLDTACVALLSVAFYVVYHLILRWRYSFDELASVLLAAVIIHQIQRARVLSRLNTIVQALTDSNDSLHISTISTPTVHMRARELSPRQRKLDMLAVLKGYQAEDHIEHIDDAQFSAELPPRRSLHEVVVYNP